MREERRISLRSLARRLGISAAFLVDLEKDRRQPTPQLMQKLADEIDVPLSDFDKFSPDLPKAVKDWISKAPLGIQKQVVTSSVCGVISRLSTWRPGLAPSRLGIRPTSASMSSTSSPLVRDSIKTGV